MNNYEYSDAGLALTKSFEGSSLTAYQDVAGIWTIGYGHTGPSLLEGMKISQADADALLRADLAEAVRCVRNAITEPITQGQFDAMVDFCFNVGRGNFLQSSLRRKVNLGDHAGAAGQFGLWINAGGKPVDGLIRRRAAERALFTGTAAKANGTAAKGTTEPSQHPSQSTSR
jgi:lysozyme